MDRDLEGHRRFRSARVAAGILPRGQRHRLHRNHRRLHVHGRCRYAAPRVGLYGCHLRAGFWTVRRTFIHICYAGHRVSGWCAEHICRCPQRPDRYHMLAAYHLRKTYGSLLAVSDVDFTIGAGEILGYIGPNGAGKSTTVKMIAGLIEPSAGEVLFNGSSIQKDLVAYKRQIGYVPEEPNLYPYLTAREYLDMIGTLRGMTRNQRLERIDALMRLFSLHSQRYFPLSAYSKGMRQKVL